MSENAKEGQDRALTMSDSIDLFYTTTEMALSAVLPLLERLGDFVGNGELKGGTRDAYDRCDVIMQVREALARVRAAHYGERAVYWMTDGIEWAPGRLPDLPEDVAYHAACSAGQQARLAIEYADYPFREGVKP